MDRREALKSSGLLMATGLSLGTVSAFMQGCKTDNASVTKDDWAPQFFSDDQVDLMAELAERIIPKTDTPGAKDALVHRHLDANVKDNFTPEEQQMFLGALDDVDVKSNSKFGKAFIAITDEEKDGILTVLADEAEASAAANPEEPTFFPTLKGMVVYSFVTSEVAANEFFKFDPIPGEYKACIDLEEVGVAWAPLIS